MLKVMTWDPSFSVGHPLLDDQHKTLLRLCQQAAAALAGHGPRDRDQVQRALAELADFARMHFAAEEALLEACAYPQAEAHAREHREYEERLMQILILTSDGTMGMADLYSYAMAWWTDHVLGTDLKYGPYLSAPSPALE